MASNGKNIFLACLGSKTLYCCIVLIYFFFNRGEWGIDFYLAIYLLVPAYVVSIFLFFLNFNALKPGLALFGKKRLVFFILGDFLLVFPLTQVMTLFILNRMFLWSDDSVVIVMGAYYASVLIAVFAVYFGLARKGLLVLRSKAQEKDNSGLGL